MRGFFLLLLLTNVAVLGWQYLQHDAGSTVDPYRGITFDGKGLTLLSELPADKRPQLREGGAGQAEVAKQPAEQTSDAQDQPGAAPVAQGTEQGKTGQICLKVSGVEERSSADKLIAGLKKIGAVALEQGSEQGEETNYWVMLPPYKNKDQASAAAAALGSKKLKDFFIVRSGDYVNAVSLGVFSTRERAKRRYDQVLALKLKLRRPKIEEIKLPLKRYWVSWKLTEASQQTAAKGLVSSLGLENSKEISCE